jgi:hypothetical protein
MILLTRNALLTSKQIRVYFKLRTVEGFNEILVKFPENGNNAETYKS